MATAAGFEFPEDLACETVEVSEGGRLVIGAWAGSVNVSAGSRRWVEVGVRCRGVLPPPVLEIERDGDDVYVEARSAPLLQWLRGWAWRKVRLEVSVPPRYSVEVETRAGRVEIRDVDGQVEARSRAGHLVFRNVRGPIDGRTRGGSIDVSGCCGNVDVATSGGSIEIRNVDGPVSAHSRNGRIAVMDSTGELHLRSGGSIQIEETRAKLMAFA